MRAKPPPSERLAITTQFRSHHAMVYEFEGFGAKLSIRISERESDEDEDDWCVQAGAEHGPTVGTIIAWGPTRGDALEKVALEWNQEAGTLGLPRFDWDEVARLLTTVAAL